MGVDGVSWSGCFVEGFCGALVWTRTRSSSTAAAAGWGCHSSIAPSRTGVALSPATGGGAAPAAAKAGEEGQTVELNIRHAEAEPAEAPHKPVSGEMAVGVSSRGGSYEALGLNIDLSKPRKALLSTRLEARIRDKATGAVLWEGRADIATRDGDPKWTDQAIATKLAGALFAGFPGKNGETIRG